MKIDMKVSNILKDLFNKLDKIADEYSSSGKKIVIWGCQKASYIASQYLIEKNCTVIGIADNDEKRSGELPAYILRVYKQIKPMEVCLPKALLCPYDKDIVILVFSRYYRDILKQASEYGYDSSCCIWLYNSEKTVSTEDCKDMQEITVEEQKQIEFEILCFLKKICTKYGLRYYLAAGTLLGALRHKGFIPWDDDIDIYMPWKDYKRLIELFASGEISDERYSLLYHGICSNYSWVYCKIRDNRTFSRGVRFPLICDVGVNIEIFPMSGVPADEALQNALKTEMNSFLSRWSRCLTFWDIKPECSFESAAEELEAAAGRYDFDESPFVGNLVEGQYDLEICTAEAFRNTVELEFNGELFTAPAGYDEFLTKMYGDYMTPPPEWLCVCPHTYRSFRCSEIVKA